LHPASQAEEANRQPNRRKLSLMSLARPYTANQTHPLRLMLAWPKLLPCESCCYLRCGGIVSSVELKLRLHSSSQIHRTETDSRPAACASRPSESAQSELRRHVLCQLASVRHSPGAVISWSARGQQRRPPPPLASV
jgi:hypothetical protein